MDDTLGCIYMHTCTVTNKSYIGQTINGIDKRWSGHKSLAKGNALPTNHFHNAIRKYGPESFTHLVLEDNIARSQLDEREEFFIINYDTYENGYNSSLGNSNNGGVIHSDYTKKKLKAIYSNRSSENKKAIAAKIGIANSGSDNGNFKSWWYQETGKEKIIVTDKSLRQFAAENNVSAGTVKVRLNKQNAGIPAKRGVFKGIAFGYL